MITFRYLMKICLYLFLRVLGEYMKSETVNKIVADVGYIN